MSGPPPPLAAALAGRYAVEREIGQGGMATVYLARDLKHDRHVAIKVLRPQYAAAIGSERFLKEIQFTAHLQHPHILALIDSGESDGVLWYAMPYVDGESLRGRLERDHRLPIDDAVRLVGEVAGALDYAHRNGLVHRDVKPENILLHDGHALVADFGIALDCASQAERITETGLSIGTMGYMSPEQTLGERELDARSDIYSLGAILYEMLTGMPPFTGPSAQAIVARILTSKPVPPSRVRRTIPRYLDDAVLTAMARDPGARFASAAAFQAALSGAAPRRGRLATGRRIAVTAAAAAGVIALFIVARLSTARAEPPAIALLHSTSAVSDSPADSYLNDGISDEVFASLTSLPGMVVRGNRRLLREPDPANGYQAIADSLGATLLVVLRVGHVGSSLRVTAELHDIRHRTVPWSQSFTEAMGTDLNAIEDGIAQHIITELRIKLTPVQLAAIRSGRTENPAAHNLLVLARGYIANRSRAPEELDTAITLVKSAIAIDSMYAQAWATLAGAEGLHAVFGLGTAQTQDFDSAASAVARALALDSNSVDGHTTLGYLKVFHERDYPGAGHEFARAIALDSNRANTWLFQAWYYVATNNPNAAVASIRHAQRLDPLDPVIATRLLTTLYIARQPRAAEAVYHDIRQQHPGLYAAIVEGDAIAATDGNCPGSSPVRSDSLLSDQQIAQGVFLAWSYALCHREADARRVIAAMEAAGHDDGFWVAIVYAALRDRDGVRQSLERGLQQQAWAMFMLQVFPAFDEYRAEPWFQQITAAVHLQPVRAARPSGGA